MNLAFTLGMPGRNSWNGRWSGDGRPYVLVKNVTGKSAKRWTAALTSQPMMHYGYNFGDGWYANVDVRHVDSDEARSLRKRSLGFCGYDWMVESILQDGTIYGPTHPKPEKATTKKPEEPK